MRLSKKLISVMLSLLMIAAMLPINALAVSGVQASEMGYASVTGLTSFNNMPSSFVETNLEKAATWSSAPSESYTYLVYDIENGIAYCAYFYKGTYSDYKTFNLSSFRNLPDSGYRVYYVTYAGEQEPAETPVVKTAQLTADKVAKMTIPAVLPEDFVETDKEIAKTWTGAAATGTTTLIYGTDGAYAVAAIFADGVYYTDYYYNLETLDLSALTELVTTYPVYYTVAKNTPDYELPTDLTGIYGETLQSVALPDGWSWENGSVELGNVGENEHVAIFTPEDTENYLTVKETLKVVVQEVDKTALKAAIDEAETYFATVKDNEEYAEALEGLEAAITDANVVFDNPNVLAATVDDKADALMTKLAIAQYKITEIDNANAIARFNAALEALPETLVLSYAEKVTEADDAYNALTREQKDIIGTAALRAARATIDDYKLAIVVPIYANNFAGVNNSTQEAAIEETRAYYEGLTDAQKALVDSSVVKDIEDAEAAMPVIKAIEALEETVTKDNAQTIKAVSADYDALTDDQKARIDATELVDSLAALDVTEAVDALPASVKATDEKVVKAARAAYDALTDEQKAMLEESVLADLEKAEAALSKALDIRNTKNTLTSALKATANKDGSITVKWGNAKADRYEVYAGYCTKNGKFKKVKTLAGDKTSFKITKLNGKKVDAKKNAKVYVVAYRNVDGKYEKLVQSYTLHIAGVKNKTYTNAKTIKVKKDAVTLDVGKSSKINATIVKQNSKKKLVDHAAKFRYMSTNAAVATVDANGKIKAVGQGSCSIYILANNGKLKTVKVTVR